jgi:hypothetical protein
MLMMCFFYCVSLAKGLFYASAPLLVLFSLFVLKRGIRQDRPALRETAFLIIFGALLKFFIWDVYLLRQDVLCRVETIASQWCTYDGIKLLHTVSMAMLILCSFVLFNIYRYFVRVRRPPQVTPEQIYLGFWANLSLGLVMLLIFWLIAPWIGYLTVGHVPPLFNQVPWQSMALVNIVVLLRGFWRAEDCIWTYDPRDKKTMRTIRTWTARDTLWISAFLLLVALAFSFASVDVLFNTEVRGHHPQINEESLQKLKLPRF